MAKIILFQNSNVGGKSLTLTDSVNDLVHHHFNDITSSVIVVDGTWQLYQHDSYQGISWTVNAHGGPDGDGVYPYPESWGGPHDVISSVKKL